MKLFLSTLFAVFVSALYSQGAKPDSVFSEDGDLISVQDPDGKFTRFDENGDVTETGLLKNGKRTGKWETFQGGQLSSRGSYSEGLPEGKWEFFNYEYDPENKEFAFVRSIGRYKKGHAEGLWQYYIGNQGYNTDAGWVNKKEFYYGYLILTGSYVNGFREGTWEMKDLSTGKARGRAYFENGKKKGTWEIEKGLDAGRLLTISPSFLDSIEIKEKFDNGSYATGFYSHGKKTGTWKYYDINNQLIRSVSEGPGDKGISPDDFSRVNIVLPNLHIDYINRIIFSPGRKYVLLCNDQVSGEFSYWLWDVDHKKMMSSGFFQTRRKEFYDIVLSPSGKYFYLYNYTDSPPYTNVYLFDIATGSEAMNLSGEGYANDHYFFYENRFCMLAGLGKDSLSFIDTKGKQVLFSVPKNNQQYVKRVLNTANPNEILVQFSDELVIYDLEQKKEVRNMPCERKMGVWTDRNFLVSGRDKFTLYDLKTLSPVAGFEIPGYESQKTDVDNLDELIDFSISPNGKTVAVAYEKNSGFSSPLQIIDISMKTLLWKSPMNMGDCDDAFLLLNDSCIVLPRYARKQDGYCSSQLHWFNFREEKAVDATQSVKWFDINSVLHKKNRVTLSYEYPGKIFTEKFNHIDLATGYFSKPRPWANPKHFQLWSDSLFVASLGADETKTVNQNAIHYESLGQVAAINEKNRQLPDVFFEDVKTGGFDEKKFVYHGYMNKASYENKTKQGRQVVFWNGSMHTEAERKVTLAVLDNGEHIFYSPDRYYMGSKNISRYIYFEKDLKMYPFEQFDLKYNRPDIILSRLGYADSALITAYRKAYLKRLRKMNFTEEMLKDDMHLPTLIMQNSENIPPVLQQDSLELNLELKDPSQLLDRINIWINDVPVYGVNGLSIREKSLHQYRARIMLKLARGKNKVQVSVLNQAGIESLKETIYTEVKNEEKKRPNLYLICIGAGKFADPRYNLNYAVKDAQDIAKMFEGNTSGLYNKVQAYVLSNDAVSTERLAELKKTLSKADRNDVVMVTVSDHGVLDKDFNYYLATYHMDFADPGKKGLAYEQLENLLDGIAPLKKVILLDACHSGEIDKEEVTAMVTQNSSHENGVTFRNAGSGIQKKNLGLKTSTELMGELFTDLRKGTGATVISSAGGMELAMESDQWKNGLFTYCLLHGLSTHAADTNRDGTVMVSELQEYLQNEVMRLSKGQQQPASRLENTETDFRIW